MRLGKFIYKSKRRKQRRNQLRRFLNKKRKYSQRKALNKNKKLLRMSQLRRVLKFIRASLRIRVKWRKDQIPLRRKSLKTRLIKQRRFPMSNKR